MNNIRGFTRVTVTHVLNKYEKRAKESIILRCRVNFSPSRMAVDEVEAVHYLLGVFSEGF